MGKDLPAKDVRVFFRLFTTAATGLVYDASSTYRFLDDGSKVVPLLDFEGGQVVTIPCLASQRVDSSAVSIFTQPVNIYSTLLDPMKFTATSVAGWISTRLTCVCPHNLFQVMVLTVSMSSQYRIPFVVYINAWSQIHFAGQPINRAATPGNDDKLSQRT
jgi:hypothetical protein